MAKGRQYSFASQFAAIAALLLFSVGTSAAFQIRLPFFSLPNDNIPYLHPSSPRELDVASSAYRTKRQAYQIYLAGDVPTITADKNSAVETGVWGPWSQERECSRTCSGGVLVEKRVCNGECTGPAKRYVSCNLEKCPTEVDFRAEQCAAHNDDSLDGTFYKWVPFTGKNKCELTCKPETAVFYYKWADKVIDGTPCGEEDDATCVDGVCIPVGCDGRLGSVAKKDKCGVCNGNETTCKSVSGVFDERTLTAGYHDVVRLPAGATGISVEEIRVTTNNLALKNGTGHFYLNGNYQIHLLDKDTISLAGTMFKYTKANNGETEKLTAIGPLTEDVIVSLLFQKLSTGKNSAVKFEYSLPLEDDLTHVYKPGKWSTCSVTCGKGVQTRTPYCIDVLTNGRVDDQLCDDNNATKPDVEKPCETIDCGAEWFAGEWEQCSESCGNNGWRYRTVYCHKVLTDGRRITVNDTTCTAEGVERPFVKEPCNRFSCPEWHTGPWSSCSEKCGNAKQYRSVTCRSEKEGEEGKLLPASDCSANVTLESERSCNLGPCTGLSFHTSDWKLCQRCNETEETRNVTCRDQTGRKFPLEKCLSETVKEIPIDTRACATAMPCVYEWHTSQWSKCSTECGHGHKTRKVHCAINELGEINIVDESLCIAEEKPAAKEECVNEAECTGTYFTGPWSNCTKECEGGTQTRIVVCLNYDKKPVPEWCEEASKPLVERECNVHPCPTCHTSEFGCCPDNVTYSLGEYFYGCSNCSLFEFGCCADNVTQAIGLNGKRCEEGEFTDELEGSGETENLAVSDTPTECEVTNTETGKSEIISCSSTVAPSDVDEDVQELLLAIGGENITEGSNATTMHCKKTEFGCCSDWYTPAEGENQAGCPEYKLGTCNDTKYGCCPDNVTLSRGPNFEGCGEPTCAASLFGCCKDRKTIAFGTHYSGCERSSFPCELSAYGCCPDGETAALDKNLTGCGASCLLTKYGCCPDGVSQSKGVNNEGCGCQYTQYGCCPDGKSPAKGAGYYGCPETCAQSQHGCCPDGKTAARGPNKEGCPCQYTRWGCCLDGETTALGPRNDGCDDCRYAKYGCCADGETKAIGPEYAGCPTTTAAPYIIGGTVSPHKIAACVLPQDQGNICHPGYKLVWFYDTNEGRCSQFWYGGCGGNENNFGTKEQCEKICVEPPELGRCYLPKIEGPQRCNQLVARYYYDHTTRQCAAFWWRGCLGNANNFASWEECQAHCSHVGPLAVQHQQIAQQQRVAQQQRQSPYGPPYSQQEQYSQQERPLYYQPHRDVPVEQSQPGAVQQLLQRSAALPSSVSDAGKSREICSLKLDVGRCEGHFDSWYYDVARGVCEPFQYSGCGGNANRFNTKELCEGLCLLPVSPDVSVGGAAPGLSSFGPVNPSIGMDGSSGLKSVGVVSSVLSKVNRFFQSAKIDAALASVCEAPKDTGSCSRFVAKWYYNKADGTCNRFHYGGCEGNGNRFESEQECKNKCGDYIDACQLPKVVGRCAVKNERFYFDVISRRCLPFEFSGCLGNANNFRTAAECEQRCVIAAAQAQGVPPLS